MTLLYLSIPLMVIGITIALAPLLWAMSHREQLEDAAIRVQVDPDPRARLVPPDRRGA
jgi:hypothetical protein